MLTKECQGDTLILLFTSAITSAFAECWRELERLNFNSPPFLPPIPKTSPGDTWTQSLATHFSDFNPLQYESNHHKQDLLITTSKIPHCLLQLQIKVIKFLPWISLQLRIPHTPTLHFQSTFSAHRRSKDSLSTPGATPENFEPTWHLCSLD